MRTNTKLIQLKIQITVTIQYNHLGQTAVSRCESSPMFQGQTLSPSSGCYWYKDGNGVNSWNVGELSHLNMTVYMRRCYYWILSPQKLQDIRSPH